MVFSKIGHIQYIRGLFNILRLAGPLCGGAHGAGAVDGTLVQVVIFFVCGCSLKHQRLISEQ